MFASANMEHPQALNDAGNSGPVVLFRAQQAVRAGEPSLKSTAPTCLTACSTPRSNWHLDAEGRPSGDYALEVFHKADASSRARSLAGEKSRQLTGAADSAQPPAGR